MFIEVIALNVKDIENANRLNIDRIELCDNILYDGLSPKITDVIKACEKSKHKIRVMVRVTNDFLIHNNFELLKHYILNLKKLNLDKLEGFVFGFLNEDDSLNYDINDKLMKVAYPLKVTFHKASDVLIENYNLQELRKLYEVNENFDVILTQGGIGKVDKNIEVLEELSKVFNLLIGGGIDESNINEIKHKFDYIHLGRFSRNNYQYTNKYDFRRLDMLKSL